MRATKFITVVLALLCTVALASAAHGAPLTGAIYTTNVACDGTDINIYPLKSAVYLDGGPQNEQSGSGLPDGFYWVKVTEPNGTLLGYSTTAIAHVTNGEFDQCYQLDAILVKASNGQPGYDTTTNPGGEYKVWVSPTQDFAQQKTDNFKVIAEDCSPNCPPPPPTTGAILACKNYDPNTNGIVDPGEPALAGWPIFLYTYPEGVLVASGFTALGNDGRACIKFDNLEPRAYTVVEDDTIETNWVHTNPFERPNTLVEVGKTTLVEFCNVCLGAGGGHTLGFWSNKNGQALIGAGDLTVLTNLNLKNANGTDFNPGNAAQLKTWLLNGTATNMAYMLSVQMAAMSLNIYNGFTAAGALIYAPGTSCANPAGFCTANALVLAANAALATDSNTPAGDPNRAPQEILKNAFDAANNNLTFAQSSPCPYSFPTE